MAKDNVITMEGKVDEVLPSAMFRVVLEIEHKIIATLAGRLRQNNIRILLGDAVTIEMSPYDLNKGRITFRYK